MTTLAADDFNRADGAIGANWLTTTGYTTPQVVSNGLRDLAAGGSEGSAHYTAIVWPNDQYSQFAVVAQDSLSSFAAKVRVADAAVTFYYFIMAVGSGSSRSYFFGKAVAGTYTDLATGSVTVNNGNLIRLEVQGTNLRAIVAGAQVATTLSDSAIASGDPGIQAGVASGSLAGNILDNWDGGDLVLPLERVPNIGALLAGG